MGVQTGATRLVADIGGTNTRIALFDAEQQQFRALAEYLNADFPGLDAVIREWLTALQESAPASACIAAAAYHAGDQLRLVNCDWQFSRSELAREFGWSRAGWLNDFEANAHALPYLGGQDSRPLYSTAPHAADKLAVVGPGTGFGGATLLQREGKAFAGSAEPGHMGLSPANELELALFRHLLNDFSDIYVELLVSGPGLVRIYQALCDLEGSASEALAPSEIAQRGMSQSDPVCSRALTVFCSLFGSACGDFIVANGTWGGLFIAGGITLKIIDFLENSEFLARLQCKGAMSEHLRAVPVHLITASHPGLIGAAHAPL